MRTDTGVTSRLLPGDIVQVRTAAEILATLDANGTLDALPFMPEMTEFIGKCFRVYKRTEKICDTIHVTGSRRMHDTVFLTDLRCDGCAHDGCQAECRIYWKEAWLTKVVSEQSAPSASEADIAALKAVAQAYVLANAADTSGPRLYRCQATEAFRASHPIPSVVSPGQYYREIACGNIGVTTFIRVAVRALGWKIGARLGFNVGSAMRAPFTAASSAASSQPDTPALQPGDWVQVKSAEEIGRTLNRQGSHKGLRFSPTEMLPACGKRFRVRRRIDKLIDERTGRMLPVKNDCIALDGFVCTGDRSPGRWFCHRELYPYWREAWLSRIDPPSRTVSAAADGSVKHGAE